MSLLGTTFDNGWVIVELLPEPGSSAAPELTGGCFSLQCIVERQVGTKNRERAFLKVIDPFKAAMMFEGNVMKGLKAATDAHAMETSILDVCKKAKLDRIVKVLQSGQLPPAEAGRLPCPYILFEIADGDLRKLVGGGQGFDVAWKLRVLHDVAVGLQQLHQEKIAHQDLKPSNVLVFNDSGEGAKIGDLGRSSRQGFVAPHDSDAVAGARSYAPPEQAYGFMAPRWEDRRESCDLYHLGSLAFYLLCGKVPNEHYVSTLPMDLLPRIWRGSGKTDYRTALPFFIASLTSFISEVRDDFPDWGRDELSTILFNACHPDYEKRGDPEARARVGSPLGIETYVSRFDRLSRWALVRINR
jgi:eukaryotic-like serine/threonine-protein kinase